MIDDGDGRGWNLYRTNINGGSLGLHDALDVGFSNLEIAFVARDHGREGYADLGVSTAARHDDA